jgi:uncharacterized protein (DUF58 family)
MNLLQDQELWSQMKHIMVSLKPLHASLRTGIHEFQHRGRSLEFAEYREYRSGEDFRDLDWKVFARTDRYYLRQRDSHTPAKVMLLLDDSPSMLMKTGEANMSKLRESQLLVFGLGFILQRQGDPFSFHALNMNSAPAEPRSSKKTLKNLIQVLKSLESTKHLKNNSSQNWPSVKNLNLDHLFCISDFMLPLHKIESWLDGFRRISPKTQCIQVLDPLESGEGSKPSRVLDLENPQKKRIVSSADWNQYLESMEVHQQKLSEACRIRNIRLSNFQTNQPIATAIRSLLKECKRGN